MVAAVAAMTFVSCETKKAETANGEDTTNVEENVDTTATDSLLADTTATVAEEVADTTAAVAETTPAVKGDTKTNATKDAFLESGFLVKVPMFINQDESIIVSTIDGSYVSRA